MNKKTIISNTMLFIAIIGFIVIFNTIFGTENTLIGVSTITAMLMLLERDLTIHPISNTFKLIGLNLIIGIGAFIADLNMWAGIPITFVIMFVISYTLSYNLRNPLYFPFGLQYLFVLAFPVSIEDLPIRLASLVFGAIAIMLLQLILNKKRLTTSGDKTISAICRSLQSKITSIQSGTLSDEPDEAIGKSISGLRKMILDRRADDFYLTEEGKIRLNISASLEGINEILPSTIVDVHTPEILNDLSHSLDLLVEGLNEKKKLKEANQYLMEMVDKYDKQHVSATLLLKIVSNIDFLIGNIADLHSIKKEKYNLVKKIEQIPEKFRNVTFGSRRHQTNSIKFSFAIRLAIGMSVIGFIVDFFEIHEGRWMMFTLLSLIIPIYEESNKRVRDRVFATIVGSILVLILFNIFESMTARTLILMVSGYLMTYIKVYRYSTIIVTFSAIGSATILTGATELLTINRVLLVFAGTVTALLLNKYVYSYQMNDANKDLRRLYRKTLDSMLVEVHKLLDNKGNSHSIRNLFMTTTMIEDRLDQNIQNHEEEDTTWIDRKRSWSISIYEMFMWIEKHGIKESTSEFIKTYGKNLLSTRTQEENIKALDAQMEITESIEDKIVLSIIHDVLIKNSGKIN